MSCALEQDTKVTACISRNTDQKQPCLKPVQRVWCETIKYDPEITAGVTEKCLNVYKTPRHCTGVCNSQDFTTDKCSDYFIFAPNDGEITVGIWLSFSQSNLAGMCTCMQNRRSRSWASFFFFWWPTHWHHLPYTDRLTPLKTNNEGCRRSRPEDPAPASSLYFDNDDSYATFDNQKQTFGWTIACSSAPWSRRCIRDSLARDVQ